MHALCYPAVLTSGETQGLNTEMVELVWGLGTEAVPAVGAFFIPLLHEGNMSEQNSSVSAECF